MTWECTIEMEGYGKPACVAELVSRLRLIHAVSAAADSGSRSAVLLRRLRVQVVQDQITHGLGVGRSCNAIALHFLTPDAAQVLPLLIGDTPSATCVCPDAGKAERCFRQSIANRPQQANHRQIFVDFHGSDRQFVLSATKNSQTQSHQRDCNSAGAGAASFRQLPRHLRSAPSQSVPVAAARWRDSKLAQHFRQA